MTRQDIVNEVSESHGYRKSDVKEMFDAIMDVMNDSLVDGRSIYIRGFGTFRQVRKAAKRARDIGRGASIELPERRGVKFVPGKLMKAGMK